MASICTNSALLVCLYDEEGNWNLSPGLGAILIMEHVLLFIKFGFSRIVPEVWRNFSSRYLNNSIENRVLFLNVENRRSQSG